MKERPKNKLQTKKPPQTRRETKPLAKIKQIKCIPLKWRLYKIQRDSVTAKGSTHKQL